LSGWAFEFLHQCHQSRREIVILKLDFEKAFDLVEFSIVLDMLRAKGFPDKWILWVESLMNSATTSVLLNGTAAKEFMCKRGVRQGDPLSPILFAIAADLIQCAINHEYQLGRLPTPHFLRVMISPSLWFNTLMTLSLLCRGMSNSCSL
jgi:hypothetical protein